MLYERSPTSFHLCSALWSCAVAFAAFGCSKPMERFEYSSIIMAAEARIILYAPDETTAIAATRDAFDRMNELDAIFSDYRPDSELSQLSHARAGSPTPVSEDLYRLLARAQEISDATEGAFDITVGPLTRLWRASRETGILPAEALVAEARERTGWKLLSLDETTRTVTLAREEMSLDPGGIGKGYAADEALATLRDRGIARSLVRLGGDIAAGESPPGRPGWRIAIGTGPYESADSIMLTHQAISTSGGQYQAIDIDGRSYAHIVDPRTGLGLNEPMTFTVIAPNAATADALATAFTILGVDKSEAILDRFPNVIVYVQGANKNGTLHRLPRKRR